MVKLLLTPIRRVDAVIQRTVDWCVIGLMRHGIPKSFQIYAMGAAWILGLVGGIFVGWRLDHHGLLAVFCYVFLGGASVFGLELDRRIREHAEKRGLRSSADLAQIDAFWKLLPIIGTISTWAGDPRTEAVLITIGQVAYFIEVYMRSSPSQPPPKRQEAPTTAVRVTC